jgi:alkanesulfonate monooxygenase SsuD/methylene tetrahydromethanopterin reductase-like flavin-dependent oxidoreductase (luciferase family)
MDFMVKHGIKGIIGGGAAQGGASDEVIRRWRDTLARSGRETELGGDLIISFSIHLADTEEQAVREVRPYFEEYLKMFGPLGFVRGLSDAQLSALGDPRRARHAGLPTLEQGVKAGSWFCGPPELVTERLMAVQDKYPGLEHVNLSITHMGTTLAMNLEQLEWFGKEVLPTFKAQARATALAD